jgi:hypothetical protein
MIFPMCETVFPSVNVSSSNVFMICSRNAGGGTLYGTVVEYIDMHVGELQSIVGRLVGRE